MVFNSKEHEQNPVNYLEKINQKETSNTADHTYMATHCIMSK